MESIVVLVLFLTGILAGGYGTIVGAGGCFIFFPMLLLVLNVNPTIASGSGLVIVLINAFSGTIGYAKQKKIDYRTGILIAIGAFPGSLLGVWLLHVYDSNYFYLVFAVVLILLGVFLFIKNISSSKTDRKSFSVNKNKKNNIEKKWLLPLGLLMGTLSSYLGIGGGWLLVPILIYVFKFSTHLATATSIFSLFIYSSYGVIVQILYNSIDWVIVFWGAIGIIIGSQIGVKLAKNLSGKFIMQLLSILLIIIGIRMCFE